MSLNYNLFVWLVGRLGEGPPTPKLSVDGAEIHKNRMFTVGPHLGPTDQTPQAEMCALRPSTAPWQQQPPQLAWRQKPVYLRQSLGWECVLSFRNDLRVINFQ